MPDDFIKVKILKCKFCGHTWIPKTENPKECPKCKRYDYQ